MKRYPDNGKPNGPPCLPCDVVQILDPTFQANVAETLSLPIKYSLSESLRIKFFSFKKNNPF